MSKNNIVNNNENSNSSSNNNHEPVTDNINDEINPDLLKFKHSDIYNIKCFECDSSDADYVSINNSIFLCEKCYNNHKQYDKTFSEVRPLTDNFSEDEINLILQGGNKRLNDFLLQYKIPKNSENKYFLYALDYYRKLLRSEAFGEDFPEKPDSVSAFKIIQINNNEEKKTEIKKKSFFKGFGNFIKVKAGALKDKIKDINFKEKKEKIIEKKNQLGDKIKTLVNEFKEKRNKKKKNVKDEGDENNNEEKKEENNNEEKKNNPIGLKRRGK